MGIFGGAAAAFPHIAGNLNAQDAAKDSKFARFHANQGLVLMISEVIYWVAVAIVTAIFMAINWWLGSIFSTIFALGNIFFLVLSILGIVSAAQGQYKTLPLIGKISILK